MRRPLSLLAAALLAGLPAAAHAQACSPAQLAANPLVSMGYRALVRINNTAFDLSCYYQNQGGGQIGFGGSVSPTVSIGTGQNAISASINQALFTTGIEPLLNYGVSSNIGRSATASNDFIFAFAAPLTSTVYTDATAQVGVTRASGSPNVSIVPSGAPSTVALGGQPAYLVAQSTFLAVHGGGSSANPFASNLGVDVGGSACTTGTACSYGGATSSPNANISAWGTVISYRETRTTASAANAQVNGEVSLSAVPEPATITLMATGLLAVIGTGYTRRRSA